MAQTTRGGARTSSQPRQQGKATRPRSFGGCYTCRTRHVKCDENQPACLQCQRADIVCGGYRKDIFFDTRTSSTTNNNNNAPIRFRRPLLTVSERKRMSQWITTSVAPAAVNRVLARIDETAEQMSTGHDGIEEGPFTVFRPSESTAVPSPALPATETLPLRDGEAGQWDAAYRAPEFLPWQNDPYAIPDLRVPPSDMERLTGLIMGGSGQLAAAVSEPSRFRHNVDTGEVGASGGSSTSNMNFLTHMMTDSAVEPAVHDDQGDLEILGSASSPTTRELVQCLVEQAGQMDQHSMAGPVDAATDIEPDQAGMALSLSVPEPTSSEYYPLSPSFHHEQHAQNDGDINNVDDDIDIDHPHLSSPDWITMPLPLPLPLAPPEAQKQLLGQAIPLLQHYGLTVVSFMSPFRHHHTPWHSIFLPHIKSILASLALQEPLSAANLTIFYGTLAVSALTMGAAASADADSFWREPARAFHRKACQQARAVLELAYAPAPEQQRQRQQQSYKEALMALLTMAQVAAFQGQKRQTEGFLLEAEKLVRLRGLTVERKSRPMRLLHHCYVYMRLFHETSCVGPAAALESAHRRQVRQAVEGSGMLSYMKDNLSFRVARRQWLVELRWSMAVPKPQLEGENDLHISLPGWNTGSMYPEIFGIPESFFFYLSQVIRLGNEKDLAEMRGTGGGGRYKLSLEDFLWRAKLLERAIEQLWPRGDLRRDAPAPDNVDGAVNADIVGGTDGRNAGNAGKSPPDDTAAPHVLPDILDGMQRALSIYFYRRIYDVRASLLQDAVVAVRDWLFLYERANPDLLYGSFGLLWPAFVAACEAESLDVQASFAEWYNIAARRSGLPCLPTTLQSVQRVWRAKREAAAIGETVTWLDVARKEGLDWCC